MCSCEIWPEILRKFMLGTYFLGHFPELHSDVNSFPDFYQTLPLHSCPAPELLWVLFLLRWWWWQCETMSGRLLVTALVQDNWHNLQLTENLSYTSHVAANPCTNWRMSDSFHSNKDLIVLWYPSWGFPHFHPTRTYRVTQKNAPLSQWVVGLAYKWRRHFHKVAFFVPVSI